MLNKITYKLGLFMVALLALSLSVAASADIDPSQFSSTTYVGNYTDGGGGPTTLNHSRGYIHVMNITESQQTPRWKAYVGNISGELSIGDGSKSLFDWPLTTVVGEMYATRYHGTTGDLKQGTEAGTPIWANMACASGAAVDNETSKLSHDYDLDVDALNRTFVQEGDLASQLGTAGTFTDFTIGDNNIDTSSCYGTFLNSDGNDQTTDWQQVVLEDSVDNVKHDVTYSVMLEDGSTGFNGDSYDYQMLLPENGAEGDQANEEYYFYLELLGDTN